MSTQPAEDRRSSGWTPAAPGPAWPDPVQPLARETLGRCTTPLRPAPCPPFTVATGDNQPMSAIERPLPPLNADERTTLES
jgi:hypothetical protein